MLNARAQIPSLLTPIPNGADYVVLCAVTEREVKQLWRLFKDIDLNQDGKVSSSEMITIPQLEFNPLGKRVVDRAMQMRGTDLLSFKARARRRTCVCGHAGQWMPYPRRGAGAGAGAM